MKACVYCSIGAHDKCTHRGCHCNHQQGGGTTMTDGRHDPKPIECDECGEEFRGGAALASHMRAKHGYTGRPRPLTTVPPPSNDSPYRWEDPPASRSGPHANLVTDVKAIIPELRSHPGRWLRFRDFASRTSAGTARGRLKASGEFPDLEFRPTTKVDDAGSALFIRYVEEA